MKIKLITGFRRDQEYSIDADEAHKAYYLFLHPEARSVFNNGVAIIGSQIQEIVPDYQGTMGWNATHVLDSDDWNEINEKGISRKIQDMLTIGKKILDLCEPNDLNIPLTELSKIKYPLLQTFQEGNRGQGVKSIGDILKK